MCPRGGAKLDLAPTSCTPLVVSPRCCPSQTLWSQSLHSLKRVTVSEISFCRACTRPLCRRTSEFVKAGECTRRHNQHYLWGTCTRNNISPKRHLVRCRMVRSIQRCNPSQRVSSCRCGRLSVSFWRVCKDAQLPARTNERFYQF